MDILLFIKALIEELWQVVVIIWNLPVGIIELIWNGLLNKEKFKYNWDYLKSSIKGESYGKKWR